MERPLRTSPHPLPIVYCRKYFLTERHFRSLCVPLLVEAIVVWSSKNLTLDGSDMAGSVSCRKRHLPVKPEDGIAPVTTSCFTSLLIKTRLSTAPWEIQPPSVLFLRAFRIRSIALRRSSGLNFSHRILASCDAAGFWEPAFFLGPHRAREAALISSLRSSGDTPAHRLAAPFCPPALCRLLTDFFGRKPKSSGEREVTFNITKSVLQKV
jgi:hypothetical protein